MLSGAVKAEVTMEEKMLPSGTPEAGFYKWLSNVSATDDSKVSTLASSTAESSPKTTLETLGQIYVHKKLMPNSTTADSKQSDKNFHSVGRSPLLSDKSSVPSLHATTTSFSAHVSSREK